MTNETSASRALACSFCGKGERDVRKMVAGPKVFICDECVDICKDIVDDGSDRAPTPDEIGRVLNFLLRKYSAPSRDGPQIDLVELRRRSEAEHKELPEILAALEAAAQASKQ